MKRVMVWMPPSGHSNKPDETGSIRATENPEAAPVRTAHYRPKGAKS